MLKGTKYEGTAGGAALAKLIGASLVGGVVGGGEGAAYGAANYQYNYLTRGQLEKQFHKMIECENVQSCIDKVAQKYKSIDDIQDQALADCRTIACVSNHVQLIEERQVVSPKTAMLRSSPNTPLDAAGRINSLSERLVLRPDRSLTLYLVQKTCLHRIRTLMDRRILRV
ncbi:hypothetical protein [Rhizobium leguminosarum]|uniref:hypothetical protein n=1 Tax=Rhizobium leguminosarum TaxID=384 RepID=UPI0021B0D26C|nr:hypothetical protein [Rhizobium leguminosarum]